MHQGSGAGIDPLEKLQNLLGGVAGEPAGDFAEGVVGSEDAGRAGELLELVEDREQKLAVGVAGARGEEVLVGAAGGREAFFGAGDPRRPEEIVVFEEADKHGGEHPADGGLGDAVGAPFLEGGGGALRGPGPVVFGAEAGADLGDVGACGAGEEIGLDLHEELFEILKEPFGVERGDGGSGHGEGLLRAN